MVDLSDIEDVKIYQFCNTDTGEEYRAEVVGGYRLALWRKTVDVVGDLSVTNSLNIAVSSAEWMRIHAALSKKGIIGKEIQDGKK